jgi:hypothetical protein
MPGSAACTAWVSNDRAAADDWVAISSTVKKIAKNDYGFSKKGM